MDSNAEMRSWRRHIWWVLAVASLVTLALWLRPSVGFVPQWDAILIGAAFTAFIANFPIPVGRVRINFTHAIGLTLGVALGPGAAGLSILIGLAIGESIRFVREFYQLNKSFDFWRGFKSWTLSLSRQLLSISGGLTAFLLLGGSPLVITHQSPSILASVGLGVAFTTLFISLHWLDHLLFDSPKALIHEFPIPFLVALIPVPFGVINAAAYIMLGFQTLIIYGAIVSLFSLVVSRLVVADRDIKRRIQEISTISRISQAMRSSLDLEDLLTTIYTQVSQLLQVNNFYVALHDTVENLITYPLAIRNGENQEWYDRNFMDRLTDRVILQGTPILITHDASQALRSMGLPEIENAPEAWLGVPLVSPERTIGCLAVFHTDAQKSFENHDLDILTTLSGQAAVAIENALLYEQTRNRAQALASLNEITALMSSTLDPERALELVSQSIIRVSGGEKSAIFLFEKDLGELFLAHGLNLTDGFMKAWMTIPMEEEERIQAFIHERPILVADVDESELSEPVKTQMKEEGIRAFADFPLITPSGTIGQLSVYFAETESLQEDQIDLLKTFAAQAALAVANARAHAATDLALRKQVDQLATLEAIGLEMNATLDTKELFEAILKHALRITNASQGNLSIFDPEQRALRIVAQRSYPDAPRNEESIFDINDGAPGVAYRTGKICNVADASSDPNYSNWIDDCTHSLLSVPITRQDSVLGVITVENTKPSAFNQEHEKFLSQLAAQAAVAITNARLYQQLETRFHEQSLLFTASTHIASTLDSDAIAIAIAESVSIALESDGAKVSRWDPNQNILSLQAGIWNGTPEKSGSVAIQAGDVEAIETAMRESTTVQWTLKDAPSPAAKVYLSAFHGAASILIVPIIAGDQTLGTIEVFSAKERLYVENTIRTAQTIASQAAIALENAELFRRIRESHNRLLAILNSTRESMLMIDPQGRIILANTQFAAQAGLPIEQLIGKNLICAEFDMTKTLGFSSEDLQDFISRLQHGDADREKATVFEGVKSPRRTFQRSITPVRDAIGLLIGSLLVFRDVTEEQELEEARKQLTEMIVHDLRGPLTAILGSLKLLEESIPAKSPSPVASQAITISHRSVQQMLDLVNSLLDIAKLESDEIDLFVERISIKQLCEEMVETYVHEANDAGIILDCTCAQRLSKISIDKEKIRRVIGNLLDNALRFTPAGGRVDLTTQKSDGGILIQVIDTGPGVPKEFRERIFERFSQVPGLDGKRRGTGLGLAFARLAVDAHGGRIWVDENPDGGSIFCVFLPYG